MRTRFAAFALSLALLGRPTFAAEPDRGPLTAAALHLEKGDHAAAEPHLARYVAQHPEHYVVRAHYAELLWRLGRAADARRHFERFIADIQDVRDLAAKHLLHCHSRLMEIAEAEGDDYAEHLHRGIGLYHLARVVGDDGEGECSQEAMLCKAAGELTMARQQRRDEARPSWYLYEVWNRLDQRRPAVRHLRDAERTAPFSDLTPAERRGVGRAFAALQSEGRGH